MKVKQKKCLTSVFTCDTLAVLWNEVNSVLKRLILKIASPINSKIVSFLKPFKKLAARVLSTFNHYLIGRNNLHKNAVKKDSTSFPPFLINLNQLYLVAFQNGSACNNT